MDRTTILLVGAIAWTVVAVDALLHLVNGDLFVPIGMAVVTVGYVAVRQTATRLRPAPARATADTAS